MSRDLTAMFSLWEDFRLKPEVIIAHSDILNAVRDREHLPRLPEGVYKVTSDGRHQLIED